MDYYQKLEKIKAIIEKDDSPYLTYLSIKAVITSNPKPDKQARYTLEEIAHQITDFTGITMDELNENSRRLAIIPFRQMAHYKATKFTFCTIKEIGEYFGNKKHATILNSKRKIQNRLETDKRFREQYETFLNN